MSVPAAPLASGRDADVYLLGDGRVLRRYREGGDVTAEAELMRYVGGLGYPVPAVHEAAGADLVLELLDGPTMLAAVAAGALDAHEAALTLADLHDRLHRLPGRPGHGEGARVIHLDLHPENVMLVSRGPVVIDWRNARDGDPDVDVALTALILAQLAVDDADDRSVVARQMLEVFVTSVGHDPGRRLAEAAAIRGNDANITPPERERLGAANALVRASR